MNLEQYEQLNLLASQPVKFHALTRLLDIVENPKERPITRKRSLAILTKVLRDERRARVK